MDRASRSQFARSRWAVLALFLLSAIAPGTRALYAEQVDQYTWHTARVGPLKQIVSAADGGLFVSSREGVVAQLDARDGSILWRKVLSEGISVTGLTTGPDIIVATVDEAPELRVYDAGTGQLLWDARALPSSPAGAPTVAVAPGLAGCWLAALTSRDVVEFRTCALGELATKFELDLPGCPRGGGVSCSVSVHTDAKNPTRAVLTSVPPGSGTVTEIVLDITGTALSTRSIEFGTTLSTVSSTPDGGIVALTADGASACFAPRDASIGSCISLPAPALSGGDALRAACSGSLPVQTVSGGVTISLSADGEDLRVEAHVPRSTVSSCTVELGVEVVWFASISDDERMIDLRFLRAGKFVDTFAASVPLDSELTSLRWDGSAALTTAAVTAAPSLGWVVSLSDGGVAGVRVEADSERPASLAWSRAEGLALVESASFFELPAPTAEAEAEWTASAPSLLARTRSAALKLAASTGLLQIPAGGDASAVAGRNERLLPFRDADGFRAQLLVRTRAGDVAALHNGDGRVLWRARASASPRSRIARWLDPHERGVRAVAVLFDLGRDLAIPFDAYSGSQLPSIPLPEGTTDVVPLPSLVRNSAARADQYGYLAVHGTGVSALPDVPAVAAAAAAADLVLVKADQDSGVVTGSAVGGTLGGRPRSPQNGSLSTPWGLWSSRLGASLALATPPRGDEPAASAVHVTGAGSLLVKHLDPNVLLVASELASGSLEIRILDGGSGRTLHAATHARARGPVTAALAENWVVYTFRARGEPRVQVASVELFASGTHIPGALSLAAGGAGPDAARGTEPPSVVAALYVVRHDAAALTVTRATRGVTSRVVLLSTRGGELATLDRRVLNPRRPRVARGAKPNPNDVAEGLAPYAPELPVTSYATYGARIARLHGTASAGAELESASLLFAWGIDTYAARLAPSRTYDMVPDDFPAALLVVVVLTMTIGAVVLKSLVARRIASTQWE